MLRMFFVLSILVIGPIAAFVDVVYALALYLWWAYFRPDYWVFTTTLHDLPISFAIGVFLLFRAGFSGNLPLKFDARTMALVGFASLSTISTFMSLYFSTSALYWWDFARSLVITYVIAVLASDLRRFRIILLSITLSLGFEATKQGWLQLLTNPGAMNGNDVAFLGDNNLVAVGMLMLACMTIALARTSKTRAEQWLHIFMTIGVLYRAVSTYSRGGFLALGALGVIYVLRSPHKIRAILGAVVAAMIIYPVLPDEYWDRMRSIDVRQQDDFAVQDDSALSRLHFWQVAIAMAEDRPLVGVGVNSYMRAYDRYDFTDGQYGRGRAVHSTWMGCLAELGFTGFILYLLTLSMAMWACWRARWLAKRQKIPKDLGHYATAIESALIVLMVGGTFVLFFYVEMLWHVIGLAAAIHYLTARYLAENTSKSSNDAAQTMGTKSPFEMTAVASGARGTRGAVAAW